MKARRLTAVGILAILGLMCLFDASALFYAATWKALGLFALAWIGVVQLLARLPDWDDVPTDQHDIWMKM